MMFKLFYLQNLLYESCTSIGKKILEGSFYKKKVSFKGGTYKEGVSKVYEFARSVVIYRAYFKFKLSNIYIMYITNHNRY